MIDYLGIFEEDNMTCSRRAMEAVSLDLEQLGKMAIICLTCTVI